MPSETPKYYCGGGHLVNIILSFIGLANGQLLLFCLIEFCTKNLKPTNALRDATKIYSEHYCKKGRGYVQNHCNKVHLVAISGRTSFFLLLIQTHSHTHTHECKCTHSHARKCTHFLKVFWYTFATIIYFISFFLFLSLSLSPSNPLPVSVLGICTIM